MLGSEHRHGVPERRALHVLLPHPPLHARRVRRRVRPREGEAALMRWKRHWRDLSERLPVDVYPCSNGEFFPEEPSRREQRMVMALAEEETERQRRRFGMSRRDFVRSAAAFSIGLWAIDQVIGDECGQLRVRRQHAHERGVRPGVAGRAAEQPARRVHLRRPVPPRGLRRAVAGDQPGHSRRLRRVLAAGRRASATSERPVLAVRDAVPRRPRDRPDENLVPLPLPEGAVPRLLHEHDGALRGPLRARATSRCPIDEAALTVDTVKQLAGGTQRTVMHAFVMPNRGSLGHDLELARARSPCSCRKSST